MTDDESRENLVFAGGPRALAEYRRVLAERDALRDALLLACARIADGPQRYHEANTPEGWAGVYLEAARGKAD